jgi:hypothetical protein
MSTSGITGWSLTASEIIQAALHENGIVPLGEVPEAEEAHACLLRLNAILKSWQIGLHLEAEASIVVLAGNASVALDGGVDTVIAARLVNSATSERPLARWERDDYLALPNKAATGSPSVFYVSEDTLYVWPVPTANATIKIDYLRKPETITEISQTVDFPEKYQEALYAMLAVRCAGLFGSNPSPELVQRAERLRREAEDAERPAYYTMDY